MAFKQAIIVRTDLGMGKGKLCTQSAHASLLALKQARRSDVRVWERSGAEKIVLKVGSEKELLSLFKKAKAATLPCALVRDAGKTQIPAGTPTAIAIGPAPESEIDKVTGMLKLL